MKLKTLKQVLLEVDDYKKPVIRDVIHDIWIESVEDVINHGADAGFGNFCYYSDTCKFYTRHRESINRWVKAMAEEIGESPVEMVGAFVCIRAYDYKTKKWNDSELRDYIGVCIYGGKLDEKSTIVENALAWFALEETCRLFEK